MFFIVRPDSKYVTPESLKFISYVRKQIQIKSPNFKVFFILSFKDQDCAEVGVYELTTFQRRLLSSEFGIHCHGPNS